MKTAAMQSNAAPAPSNRKGWSPEARARRSELARDTPRGPLPAVIVAERGGWEIALDRPDAVVLDLHAACLRRGLTRVLFSGRLAPRLIEFALRRLVDDDLPRAEMAAAVWPDRARTASSTIAHSIGQANDALRLVGLQVVVLWGGTLRLSAYERSPS